MASRQTAPLRELLQQLLRLWWQLPPWPRVGVVVVLGVLLVAGMFALKGLAPGGGNAGPGGNGDSTAPPMGDAGPGTYLFCFWNVENLFDDQADGRTGPGDNVYDPWMANDADARQQKLAKLCDVLLHADLNGGKGPDILALCEVESERAVELLQNALNARLTDPALRYGARAWAGAGTGRHIGPAVLARLPLKGARQLGNRQRILETRVVAAGSELVVIASHWSSRVSDKKGTGRAKYADTIYGRFRQVFEANADVPLLACGDFNDDPTDVNVTDRLRATGDREAVRDARPPMLFNPFAALFEEGKFSLWHSPKGHVFDQICLSRGLLGGGGWSYVEGSARIVPQIANRQGHPNRFGGKGDARKTKGASDHFPVTVRLRAR